MQLIHCREKVQDNVCRDFFALSLCSDSVNHLDWHNGRSYKDPRGIATLQILFPFLKCMHKFENSSIIIFFTVRYTNQ